MRPVSVPELLNLAPSESTAVVLPERGIRISYEGLREQVATMAGSLAAVGIGRGDRVATVLPSGLPAIVTFLAASIAGTAAPLNPAYRRDEFRFYLEDTAARILLCPPDAAEEAREAAKDLVPVYEVDMDKNGFVRMLGVVGNPGAVASPTGHDIALVLHTSGSTGRPKRVPIGHSNVVASTINIQKTYALSSDDVSLSVMPLFHVHGLVASVLSTFLAGGTVVVPSKFSPLSFWQHARDTGATWYSAVPTIHQLLLTRASGKRPQGAEGLRFIRSCSAALAPTLMQQLEQIFEVPVLEAYGMTEAAHQMCSNPLPPGARKPGSVGPPTGLKLSIMNDADGHLHSREIGEVVIQGSNVVREYENNNEANERSFTNGWFRTGDQGYLDDDGYLILKGRIKDLINRAGEKIAPTEIDEVLLAHPAVAEAVAFGLPHAIWGEEVAAAVVLRTPEKESTILAYCRARLADFKCPKKLYIVQNIPRTATGKIQRAAVASAIAGEQHSSDAPAPDTRYER
jgi:acyl-CoA synthetase (AMP-forming)/AMP-acid ligase II